MAARQFDEFVGLRDAVSATASGLNEARDAAGKLASLKDQILAGDDNVQLAERNARILVAMNQALGNQSMNTDLAQSNLDGILGLQKSLNQQTEQLAMMESTVGRVAQVIKPLAEIGNLTNLNESELRAAARSILDRRATRLAQYSDSGRHNPGNQRNAEGEDGLVPLPPEARQ